MLASSYCIAAEIIQVGMFFMKKMFLYSNWYCKGTKKMEKSKWYCKDIG